MRLITNVIKFGVKSFNPRICKRCDLIFFRFQTRRRSFNPRICKRCDIFALEIETTIIVSIHASVKDATALIKIHFNTLCFNPRICKRCDRSVSYSLDFKQVSIHASVKDATMPMMFPIQTKMFQSTHL